LPSPHRFQQHVEGGGACPLDNQISIAIAKGETS